MDECVGRTDTDMEGGMVIPTGGECGGTGDGGGMANGVRTYTRSSARRAERRQWAAWRVRATWREGEDWGGKYRTEVRNGVRPVRVKAEVMWSRWCEMHNGKEVHVEMYALSAREV